MKSRIALAALATVLTQVPFHSPFAAEALTPAAAVRAPAVTIAAAQKREVIESISLSGTLVARDEVLVGPEIEGLRIIELLAEEGDRVKKGDVLARLSRDQLDAQLAQSDAGLARADAAIAQTKSQIDQAQANQTWTAQDLERAQLLLKQGSSTQAQVDQKSNAASAARAQLQSSRDAQRVAEADKANLQAQRRELMVRIGRTEVRAPADGVVSRRSAKVGAMAAGAAEPMFRIIANGAVELEAEIPEARMSAVRVGLSAKVTLASGAVVPARVRLLSPEIDRTTRLGRVRVALDDNSGALVGSFARGSIELRRATSVMAPTSAVFYADGKPHVQLVQDNVVKTRPVEIGVTSGSLIEIRSGLDENMKVVSRAGAFLRDGDAVAPVAETP